MNERGAKISFKSVDDFLILLELKEVIQPYKKIELYAIDFEGTLKIGESSKIIKSRRYIKEHIIRKELTQKSLASIICYIFYNFKKPDVIENKLISLFDILQVKYGNDYYKQINTIISDNINQKLSDEKERNILKENWSIKLDESWKINSRIKSKKNKINNEIIQENKFRRKINWKYLILATFIGLIFHFVYKEYKKRKIETSNKQKLQNIIQKANTISSSRNRLLSDVYLDIYNELENDYDKDGKRNLSNGLTARIISLCEDFKPYRYLKNGEIIEKPLSPERAKLFLNLFNNKMDDNNFFRIISNANFTYSDFSYKNLNGLDLTKPLFGIEGHYNHEVNILITPVPIIDFSYSNFRGANLDNVILFGLFSYCDFRSISSNRIGVLWSDLSHSNFQEVSLKNCRFENTKLNHVNFSNSNLGIGDGYDKGFISCDLRGSIFDNSNFSGGNNPFLFDNCFFSSTGTFFTYNVIRHNSNEIHLFGDPFIDAVDNYHPSNMYEILCYSRVFNENPKEVKKVPYKISRFINPKYAKTQNIALNTNFRIRNKWNYNEKQFWDILKTYSVYVKDPVNYLNYFYVRTNDNINRNRKTLRFFDRFYDTEWNDKKAVMSDTLIVRSRLNNLQSEYRGIIYNHKQTKDSLFDGIASFKNCSFTYTHFSNSSMEFVNFNNSKFIKNTDRIANQFNNIRFKGNDMRIKSGAFLFSNETSYNDLLINSNFPLLKFILNKNKLIGGDYNKQFKNGKRYKTSDILTVSDFHKKQILEWIKINEKTIQLDSTNQGNGEYILKNTSIKEVSF